MPENPKEDKKEDNSLRTLILAVIFIPIIAWLLYNGYQKYQQSGEQTTACADRCTAQGYPGYEFKWPIFSGPQCTCMGPSQ